MAKISHFHSLLMRCIAFAAAAALLACSPKYNWREVRGEQASFVVLLPGKPASHSREIDLNGIKVTMTMTAAEVDGVIFAVGSAQLPDQAAPQAALQSMKTAMVRNINGTIRNEKSPAAAPGVVPDIDIEAVGTARNGRPALLFAHFAAKNQRVYQAVVVGREQSVSRDAVDTFMSSFKLN
jgi:hypothetical protein